MAEPVPQTYCRAGVPGCTCDYCSPEWIAYAAEYGIVLRECAETCRHHGDQR